MRSSACSPRARRPSAAFTRWPRFSLEDVHRFIGLLVGTFVAIHVDARELSQRRLTGRAEA